MYLKRRLSRRDFLRLSVAAGAGTVLAACAPKATETAIPEEVSTAAPAGPEKVPMTVWTNDRLYVEQFKNVSSAFAEAHPEYDFEFVIEENPDLWDNLVTLFAGGMEDVDIVAVDESGVVQLWETGIAEQSLIPLNDLMTQDEMDQYMCWERYTYKGKAYGVETSLGLCAYFYQPAIFEKYGIDMEAIENYDEFMQAGDALAADGKYMTIVGTTELREQLQMLATQNDGGYFNGDGEVIIDSPETIEAVQLGYDMVNTRKVALASADQYSPAGLAVFSEGLVAGVLHADWYSGYFVKDLLPEMAGQWRLRPMPRFRPGGRRTGSGEGSCHSIMKSSKHPDLAFDFTKLAWLDRENLVAFYLMSDYFPIMKACWDDPRILGQTDPYYGDQETGAMWAGMAPEEPFTPSHGYKAQAIDITSKVAIVPIFEGEKTVEQGLKDAADAVRELIGA